MCLQKIVAKQSVYDWYINFFMVVPFPHEDFFIIIRGKNGILCT